MSIVPDTLLLASSHNHDKEMLMDNGTQKKAWSSPSLTVHGDVEAITQTRTKQFGNGDGIVLIIANIISVPIKDYPTPS
jgi:hypothetical protein